MKMRAWPVRQNFQCQPCGSTFSKTITSPEIKKALEAVITTLNKMSGGGIYDHLGRGFARYSTDATWKVPHFEKCFYDNGQLVSLYAHAHSANRRLQLSPDHQ